MAIYNKDQIVPIDQLGINLDDPLEVYSWNPRLEGEPEEAKAIAIYNLSIREYLPRQNSQGLNNLTTAGLISAVMPAVTEYFIDPLFFEDKARALSTYRVMVVNIINFYVQEVNDSRGSKGKKKLEMISSLGFDALVETLFGFYHIVNNATSSTTASEGVLMAISKDEERDPNAVFIPMKDLLSAYMPMIPTEKNTKENIKRINRRIKDDHRTVLNITDGAVAENKNKDLKDAVPCKNGIYIKRLYDQTGELMSYREAYKQGMYIPISFAANYLGPDNPPPTVTDEYGTFDPQSVVEDLYYRVNGKIDPEREKQYWAMVLSCFRIYDNSYGKGHFQMDEGLGSTGKSTNAKFVRHTIGLEHCTKLSITDIEKGNDGFKFADLRNPGICHIYSDENEPDDYHENMANLKELITGDPISVSQKYEDDATVIFKGRMLQNINNGVIKSKDNGGALYRRINGLKFKYRVDPGDGSGGEVANNPHIKDDYVTSQAWIDWLLTEAINRNVLKLPLTEESKAIRDRMEERNNKVLRFFKTRVATMQQNWFRLDYLWPAFQVFLADEKFNDKMTYTTFEDEAKKIIARRDSQWTYIPESEAKSDVPKIKNVNGITVPLTFSYDSIKNTDEHLYDLKYDMIYAALMEVTKPGSRYADYALKAREALKKMYRSHVKGPGTMRGVYYRKDAAELEMLKYLAEGVVAEHREEVSESDIYKAMSEHKAIAGADDVDDLSFGTGPIKFEKITDNNAITLIDFILKRFKDLHYQPGVM